MEISALTRSVVKSNHAVICPDGYVNSVVPGWTNCTVNVIINEQMGARFCQTLITLNEDSRITGATQASQIFFYVIQGQCTANEQVRIAGQFVYIPIGTEYTIENATAGTQVLTFHKVYEELPGYDVPSILFGDAANVTGNPFLGDPALRLQVLLPDELPFDMAVNIFTYDPGGHLPFVETHIMEHGLIYLQGQGVYMLDHQWYPIRKGDSIWMAPYCQQWFTAMGKEPAVYIYYKNVNRFPTTI
ncbi:(S)-ureidoglycine aminohydrolase [Chitinophaga sp. YR573]|uniref:(S)-ureidoglycine aminohydrolase n=1 Tax=Chitinophaga sp. YR573 TaxID=1881040 RepID=UPI0008C53935|nr:(S)-ureidoglycine aminohydrolase [Chitinophaga sp. YR573]SEW36642.1 (S)-ureidoglycine aminohydrolase [Chitinophaga sp. YR573]